MSAATGAMTATATALLAGLGVLSLPASRAHARLHGSTGVPRGRRQSHFASAGLPATAPRMAGFPAVAALAGYAGLGPAGALLAGMLALLAVRGWAARRRERAELAAVRRSSTALTTLVGQLRAGTHPAVAAMNAAADVGGRDSREGATLHAMAAHARLGGDIESVIAGPAGSGSSTTRPLMRIARAWSLAQRWGLPLADALDAVRVDLESGARLATQRAARMAGPRASVMVLAALPVLGIALGQLMGAGPLAVLGGTGHGQLLLLLGGGLLCTGTAWSARLTRQEVPV